MSLRRLCWTFLVLIFIATSSGCWWGGALSEINQCTVTGTVIEKGTSTVIAGAKVTIGNRTAETNVNGRYTISGIAPGNQTVTSSKAGYAVASKTLKLPRLVKTTTNIEMDPSRYKVDVTTIGSGRVTTDVVSYDETTGMERMKLTAYPESGWEFDGWLGPLVSNENPITFSITADVSMTAIFKKHINKLAFVSYVDDQSLDDIFIMDNNGGDIHNLTEGSNSNDYAPSWSSDGRIAYTSFASDYSSSGIYVMNSDGTGKTQISIGWDSDPSWSPDNKQIVYSSNRKLMVMNADGTNKRVICDQLLDAWNPDWSRDGTKIAFVGCWNIQDTQPRIYTINPDGTGLSNPLAIGYYPFWSQDGTSIYYVVNDDGIWRTNKDGSSKTKVVDGATDGTVTPEGKLIYYRSDNLYTSNSDGTNETKITTPAGYCYRYVSSTR